MPDHDDKAAPQSRRSNTERVLADALTSGLTTNFVVTSSDGSAIPSGTAIVDAKAYELRSSAGAGAVQPGAENVRLEIHLVSQKARVPEVEEALLRLLEVAKSDTGQSRIVADFLLSWWDSAEHGGFAVSDLFSLDGALARDVATVVAHLSRCSTAAYADAFGHEDAMAEVVARWRPRASSRAA